MIKVCDAIMGTGKTSATINYINEHPDKKFIYITPYLTEAERIKSGCPGANFVEPTRKLKKFGHSKVAHTAHLIKTGRNITTTHQAFKGYTPDMLDDVKRNGYTLIIDENVDVLEQYDIKPADLQMAMDGGYVTCDGDGYALSGKEYGGGMFSEAFRLMKSRKLICVAGTTKNDKATYYYWTLPAALIESFEDVFILTYLFDGQSIHHFLEINNLKYEMIGIHKADGGGFRFGEYPGYTPEYVHKIKDMIHIMDNKKLNAVGDDYYSMSINWFDKNGDGVEQLKRNVYNVFNNMYRNIPSGRKLWGAFSGAFESVKGRGYTKAFLAFNTKATNAYKTRTHLVYLSNIFMNVAERNYYTSHGIDVDGDKYALSIMVQWIWRSAIRDGSEIYIYIPSRRMRNILSDWMNSFSEGGEASHEEEV